MCEHCNRRPETAETLLIVDLAVGKRARSGISVAVRLAERVAISPQVQRFLTVLVAADGTPFQKSTIADAHEIDVGKLSPHQVFKHHKVVKNAFVKGDGAGRYWL